MAQSKVGKIDKVIANEVRAGGIVATIWQAVHELLANSIDAGATSVEIKVDLPCYRFSVSDDGCGISADKLRDLVGTQRATSKARCSQDMQTACSYGFRGEALQSLGLTSMVEIQSRCKGREARAKVIRGGQTLHFGPSNTPSRAGTVVTVRDAFFKWPVRRKAINEATEMVRIKDQVARMALVHNSVSITLIDSSKSKTVLRATATGSVVRTFAQIYASDKLSTAQKIAFDFKQFRITGYLSPPSSTACHWSKEFQMVYVNRRCLRRLDFLQKTINTAFAPCLTLLAGRGGSDGQGIARRVRDPNASSGKRQELFPVFVLNLECPRSEVDMMAEPDKTLVEFSDWPSAKNTPIALLLAFLSHFPHAVPSSVLRDLRRAFHRNEGGEKWTTASPGASTSRASRASPDDAPPPPPPTPSPMRLAMPDVGIPSPLSGYDDWMGRDGESGDIFDRGTERMVFQEMEISGEGTTHSFYPSPASRFGARDRSSRHVGDDIVELKVSPYFRGGVRCGDDWDARSAGDADMTCSPYFDRFDRRSRANGIRDPLPRRGSIDNRLAEIPFGDRLDYENDFREAESFPSEVVSFYRRKHSKTTGEIHAEMELESLASEGRTIRDLKRTEGRKWATEAIAAFPDGGAPLSRSSFDTIFGCSLTDLELFEDSRSIRVSPTRAGTVRDRLRGSRRKQFPGCSEEVRSDAGVGDCGMGTTAGGQIGGGNLSKLFDFAFTNKERREVQEQPNRRSRRSRNDKTLITEQFESFPSADPTAGASEAEHDARSLSSSPRLPVTLKGSPVSASTVQSLVGVTVRRPPSPKFSFMRENVSAEWPSPSRFPPSPRPEKQEDKYCDWETRGEAHNSVEGESFNARDSPSNGRIDVASHGRDDRSVLQTGDASISTPPCRTKRRRPDWSDTSVEKGASADVVSAYSKLSPVSLPVSERLPAKTPQHHRIKASQEGTEIRDRRHSIGNGDDICVADGWVDWTRSGRRRRHGWWGLGAVTAPVGEVRSRGDAAVDEASVEKGSNTSNTKDESRDLEGSRAGDLPTSDDIDHGQELRVEKKKIQTKELSGTELNTGGLLMNDGEQPMAKHRDGSGAEGMTHEDLTIENIASDNGGARTSPRSLDPVRTVDAALAYDRDVLGGDGLEDDTVDMFGLGEGDLLDTLGLPKPVDSEPSKPGGSVASPPQCTTGVRTRWFGGSMGVSNRSCSSRMGEKPISKVLESGQDEIGAGEGAVAVTVTPHELERSCVIGQAGRKFIILRARTGAILCVDQHAADERVKLENLERQVLGEDRNGRNIENMVLTPPETLAITSSDGALLEQHRKVLLSWHFDVKVESNNAETPQATMLSVPVVCGVRLSAQDLLGFLRYLRESVEPGSSPRWLRPPHVQHILNYKACHSAIRFGDLLSRSECVDLIQKLVLCARPFSCAHGRPSVVPLCVLGRATTAAIDAPLKGKRRIRKIGKSAIYEEQGRMSNLGYAPRC